MHDKEWLIRVIKDRATTVDGGVTCSSGEHTTYLNIPWALRNGAELERAVDVLGRRILNAVPNVSTNITAIGGPTTGAIPFAVGFALEWRINWFVVRDKIKDHGLRKRFVGAEPTEGDGVILIDDVVSTGNSMIETLNAVQATGATVLAVIPVVDRGRMARGRVEALGVLYAPVLTYKDLDLPPLR